jgi:hypothetical protein
MSRHGENNKIEIQKTTLVVGEYKFNKLINLNLFQFYYLSRSEKEDSVFFLSVPALAKSTAKPLCTFPFLLGAACWAHVSCMCLSVFEKGGGDENLHRTGGNRDRRGHSLSPLFLL